MLLAFNATSSSFLSTCFPPILTPLASQLPETAAVAPPAVEDLRVAVTVIDMGDGSTVTDPMAARITQLENERDQLRKDIEQLCTQQAGPSYLLLATRMHFQRTAGLEQEIIKLQKELAECTRDRLNIKEELSEAHRIKIQLEELHRVEVAKKLEFERQLKFFQGNIAAAFADRDNAFMEAEKAKEKEEIMSRKLYECQKRLEEVTSDACKAQDLVIRLQTDVAKHEEENTLFKKIVDKFYHVKQQSSFDCMYEISSYLDKCSNILDDPEDAWSFNAHREAATTESINALEQERDYWKESALQFQNKIRMGLEIEDHLKRKVRELERKKKSSDKFIKNEILRLRQYHYEQRDFVVNLLDEGKSFLMSIGNVIEQKFAPTMLNEQENSSLPDSNNVNVEDVHMRIQTLLNIGTRNSAAVEAVDTSKVLSQALQEKVSALMLLQQQEERHFLERNENAALLQRLGELQRNLNQVTAEKLEALMKLEHLERMFLQEKTNHENRTEKVSANEKDPTLATVVKEGTIKNLWKRASLKRLVGAAEYDASKFGFQPNAERYFPFRRSSNNMDVARMKIEIASLNDSMKNLEQLTSQINKLRQALVKAQESLMSENQADDDSDLMRSIDSIISEAKLVHTALSSSLPVSWSAMGDDASSSDNVSSDHFGYEDSGVVKIESVSAAGIEMVQLLLFAAEILKDRAEFLKQDI
ncbi:hypothetical protein V2J09_012413 [Rumex salicifolius]